MRFEAKVKWALIAPTYQQSLQHNSKTRSIPIHTIAIAKKINSTPAKNCTALYAASHIRGLTEHKKAQGADCQLVANYKYYLKCTRRGFKTTLLTTAPFPLSKQNKQGGSAGRSCRLSPHSTGQPVSCGRHVPARPPGAGPGAQRGTALPAATLTGRTWAVLGCGYPVREPGAAATVKNVFASQRESRDAGRTPSCCESWWDANCAETPTQLRCQRGKR
ncbi:death-associated protein 1 isoform X1 [Parus major]|uniref:death-associated protein 1 isoform X1 n=1 Tax=Parus major TaxID=9157 RepID=UPI0008F50C89|nr:death-associated protein 1 isoform X1 [Parus major]